MADYALMCSDIVKVEGRQMVEPCLFPLTRDGGLQVREKYLYQPVKDRGFVIDIIAINQGVPRLHQRFVPCVETLVNNPTLVSFRMLNGELEAEPDGDWKCITVDISAKPFRYSTILETGGFSREIVFLIDATMQRYFLLREDGTARLEPGKKIVTKLAPYDRKEGIAGDLENARLVDSFEFSLRCAKSIAEKVADGDTAHSEPTRCLSLRISQPEWTFRTVGDDSVTDTARNAFSLILFGEYDRITHPINNFDAYDQPRFDVWGIDNIELFRNGTREKGYLNRFVGLDDLTSALDFVSKEELDFFKVDGGDYEDCLEMGLNKANEILSTRTGIQSIVIFTDSPPHPHQDLNHGRFRYVSDEFYIFESPSFNWHAEVSVAAKESRRIYLAYHPLTVDFFISEEDRHMVQKVWDCLSNNNGIRLDQFLHDEDALAKIIAERILAVDVEAELSEVTMTGDITRYPWIKSSMKPADFNGRAQ